MATITASAVGGSWSSTAAWVGGVVPSAADDVLLTAASGNIVVDGNSGTPSFCRSLNCTTYTGTLNNSGISFLSIGNSGGGSLTFVSGMTFTSGGVILFASSASGNTLTFAGKSIGTLNFTGSGDWTFQDNLNASSLLVGNGTLNFGNNTVSLVSWIISGGIVNASATALSFSSFTNSGGTYNDPTGAAFITINSGGTFDPRGTVFAHVTMSGSGTYSISSAFSANASFTFNGSGVTTRGYLTSATRGTPVSITIGGSISCSNIDIEDINFPIPQNLSSSLVGDCGGNSGITFPTPITCYWKSAANGNFSAANWFTTSGGSTAARIPLVQDTIRFDANSVTTTGRTITSDLQRMGTIDWTGVLNAPIWRRNSVFLAYGSIIISSSMTGSGTQTITWANRSNANFDTGGVAWANAIIFNPYMASVTLQNNLTSSSTFSNTVSGGGSWNCNGFTAQFTTFGMSGATTYFYGGNLTTTGAITISAGTLDTTGYVLTNAAAATFSGGTVSFDNYPTGTTMTASGSTVNAGNMSISGALSITAGVWDQTNGTTLSFASFTSAGSTARTVNFGNGTLWQITGTGTIFTNANPLTSTFNPGTSTIEITNTSVTAKTFSGNTKTFYNVKVDGAVSAGKVTFSTGFNTLGAFQLNPNANIALQSVTTFNLATLNWNGTSGNLATITASTNGSPSTIYSVNPISCDYISLRDNTASGNTPFYAGSHSTNVSGNTNWSFTAGPTLTYLMATILSVCKARLSPPSFAAMLAGRSMAALKAQPAIGLAIKISARASTQVKASLAGFSSNAIVLIGRITGQTKLKAAPTGSLTLSGRSFAQTKLRVLLMPSIFLLGKSSAQLKLFSATSLAASLVGKTQAKIKAVAVPQLFLSLLGKTGAQIKATAIIGAFILIFSRSQMQIKAKSSATGLLTLSGKSGIQIKANGGMNLFTNLAGVCKSQVKGIAVITFRAILYGYSAIQIKASLSPKLYVNFFALSSIKVKGRSALSGFILLAAQSAVKVIAGLSSTEYINLMARAVIQVVLRSKSTGVVSLSGKTISAVKLKAAGILGIFLDAKTSITVKLKAPPNFNIFIYGQSKIMASARSTATYGLGLAGRAFSAVSLMARLIVTKDKVIVVASDTQLYGVSAKDSLKYDVNAGSSRKFIAIASDE